jgi:hypothetical protein
VAKDKKKKKKAGAAGMMSGKTAKRLKAITKNPLIADIVAATLVGAASALRDSRKAQRLASDAGDELAKLSKAGTKTGSALWDMALKIGRESLEALGGEVSAKPAKAKSRAKAKPAARKTVARTSPVRKPAAKRPAARKGTSPVRKSVKKPK